MFSKGQNFLHKLDLNCGSNVRKYFPAFNHRAVGELKVLCETGNTAWNMGWWDGQKEHSGLNVDDLYHPCDSMRGYWI